MLKYKKIFAIGIALLAVLVCLVKIRTSELAVANCANRVEQPGISLPKANDFSIINILSIKFR